MHGSWHSPNTLYTVVHGLILRGLYRARIVAFSKQATHYGPRSDFKRSLACTDRGILKAPTHYGPRSDFKRSLACTDRDIFPNTLYTTVHGLILRGLNSVHGSWHSPNTLYTTVHGLILKGL